STPVPAQLPGRVTRWGFFVVALVLGTALLVSSITSYMASRDLLETVIHAQADGLARRFERVLRGHRHPLRPQDLERFLDDYAEDGVQHVALFHADRQPWMEAGSSPGLELLPPGDIRVVGDRVQAAFGPRPDEGKWGPPPPEGKWGPPPPEGKWGPPPGPSLAGGAPLGPPLVVMEFVPEAALALRARTARDLLVGVTVAIALMLAAAVFWRLSRRAQAAEEHLHRQRHLAALGEMSAVLAHEIRNPLAALKGHAQLLAERVEGDPALARKTSRIVDAAQRLETLTYSLLDFARLGMVNRRTVDPAALLRRCADACEGTVEVHDEGAPPRWTLDETRIEQVLTNLLSNAAQAAPDAPIEARVHAAGDTLVFAISDQGPGIPLEEREQIFEPFHTTRTRGTGLGLAVTRRIVELHRGTVTVTDAPSGGACFTVRLPADPDA
ncbi:MAG: hypothetical protein KDK70_35225, partial [Myxococcales bacterium]|nr:hypothetical protein [Myxococcales bacterium]